MIHLLYGTDSFRVRRALHDLRASLGASDDMVEANTTVLDGAAVTPDELIAHATTVPFLANARLVIVEGLLKYVGEQKRGPRGKKSAGGDPLEPWRAAAQQLSDPAMTPPTTTLVLVEGELDPKKNAAFPIFAPIARAVSYDTLGKDELGDWIRAHAAAKGVDLSGRAIAALAQLVGTDLWTLDRELDKLAAYADGAPVDECVAGEVVSSAQEARVWDLTDAVVEGDASKALGALRRLLADGEPATRLAFMLVSQYRQIALVKDMRERRARNDEIERVTGMKSFRIDKLTRLASRYGWERIREVYARLLEADLSVKRGLQDDESSLQLLVHELCTLAPQMAVRPPYARRAGSSSG